MYGLRVARMWDFGDMAFVRAGTLNVVIAYEVPYDSVGVSFEIERVDDLLSSAMASFISSEIVLHTSSTPDSPVVQFSLRLPAGAYNVTYLPYGENGTSRQDYNPVVLTNQMVHPNVAELAGQFTVTSPCCSQTS